MPLFEKLEKILYQEIDVKSLATHLLPFLIKAEPQNSQIEKIRHELKVKAAPRQQAFLQMQIKELEIKLFKDALQKFVQKITKLKAPENEEQLIQNVSQISAIFAKLQHKNSDYPMGYRSNLELYQSSRHLEFSTFGQSLVIDITKRSGNIEIEVSHSYGKVNQKQDFIYEEGSGNYQTKWQELILMIIETTDIFLNDNPSKSTLD